MVLRSIVGCAGLDLLAWPTAIPAVDDTIPVDRRGGKRRAAKGAQRCDCAFYGVRSMEYYHTYPGSYDLTTRHGCFSPG